MAKKSLITVNVKGAKELIRKFADTGYLVEKPLEAMMGDLVEIAKDEAVRAANSRGITRSVVTEVTPLLGKVRFPVAYAFTLNKGRKPGAKMPSTRQIAGLAPPELLWIVAKTISRRGIKGRFFVRKARKAVRLATPRALERFADDVERRFAA